MSRVEAVIFAAGLGSRLKRGRPKCLVKVGGRTILEHQAAAIADAAPGCRIHVVAGFRYEAVLAQVRRIRANAELRIIRNPFFECAGINGSAWLAGREVAARRVLRLDGDLILSPSTVERLLACRRTTFLVTPCDKHHRTAVVRPSGHAVGRIELLEAYTGDFEWACAELYAAGEFQAVARVAAGLTATGRYYFEAVNRYYRDRRLRPEWLLSPEVVEVDVPEDLARARRFVRGGGRP